MPTRLLLTVLPSLEIERTQLDIRYLRLQLELLDESAVLTSQ